MKIIADDKIPYLRGVFESICNIEYYPGNEIKAELVKDADAIIARTRTKCNADLLKGSEVKFIATATIGFDHIDDNYCRKRGIVWKSAPGCNSSSVQQYITSVLFTLSNKLKFDLKDKTIGVVGVGNVGKKVVRILEFLGLKTYLNDPPRMRNEGPEGFVNIDKIKKECDIITFHTPLTMVGEDKTCHLADKSFFDGLKPGSIVINTGRGEVVDNHALLKALNRGILSGAVLDVWENEPHINSDLLNKVTLATPHIAGYSADGKANGTMMSVQAVSRFFNLGLDNWSPENIPVPENITINIDCKEKSLHEVFKEAVMHTYSVIEDDKRLRSSVGEFEKQRADYPLRREFPAFTVNLLNSRDNYKEKMEEIGFHCFDNKE
ncbi:MAG: 4-phosphoerythronate dehydrogenase PdxB [Chitinispirillia bacterium]|jgi:erythronate-4-phosphate dehydrogenase